MSAEIVVSMLAGLVRPGARLLPGINDARAQAGSVEAGGAAMAVLQNLARGIDEAGDAKAKANRSETQSVSGATSRATASAQRAALGLAASSGGTTTLRHARAGYAEMGDTSDAAA